MELGNGGVLFARLTKVDEVRREVTGRAVQEVPDKSSEIFDYESSAPLFRAWSADFDKATEGKSLGNVRAMHGKIAAGKITAIDFNDADKCIDITAKIVDDAEWAKCMEGVYTGFSIGGKYEKKWRDADNADLMRYTARPHEISIVDLPCVPTAMFAMVKADGVTEERAFVAPKPEADAAKAEPPVSGAADNAAADKIAARADASPKEGESKYGDVKFADPTNKKYPIDTEEHIRAAWNYINKESNASKYSAADAKAIKNRIVAAWKRVIDKDGPPSAKAAELATITPPASLMEKIGLQKGMWTVADFATALSTLGSVAMSAACEAAWEQDGSEIPGQLKAWLASGATILAAMATEETQEMLDDITAAIQAGGGASMTVANAEGAKPEADAIAKKDDAAEAAAPIPDDPIAKLAARMDALEQGHGAAIAKVTAEKIAAEEKNAALAKRVAELEAAPAPPKGAIRAVDKTEDGAVLDKPKSELDDQIGKAEGEQKALLLIKKAHREGGKPITVLGQ